MLALRDQLRCPPAYQVRDQLRVAGSRDVPHSFGGPALAIPPARRPSMQPSLVLAMSAQVCGQVGTQELLDAVLTAPDLADGDQTETLHQCVEDIGGVVTFAELDRQARGDRVGDARAPQHLPLL